MKKLIEKNSLTILNQAIESGGWQSVYKQCGLSEIFWTKQNQPCPFCGGRDRFSVFKKNGHTYCRHCGSRDCIKFVQDIKGYSFVEAVEFIANTLGIVLTYVEPKDSFQTDKKARKKFTAKELWESGVPLDEDCDSSRYLLSRGLPGPYPAALRHCQSLPYFEYSEDDETWHTKDFSGLICQISMPDRETVNILRIYLDEAQKADVKTPKKVLKGDLAGGSIKLGDINPEVGILGIAEGVETALSASKLFGIPVWSLVSATNFHHFVPPKEVKHLVIFADADSNETGQMAAFDTEKLYKRKYPDLKVTVRFPRVLDSDWNDVLLNQDRWDEVEPLS